MTQVTIEKIDDRYFICFNDDKIIKILYKAIRARYKLKTRKKRILKKYIPSIVNEAIKNGMK